MVSMAEFKRIEMRVGRVVKADRVPNSDKLLRLEVDFGDTRKRVITGLAQLYPPQHFEGRLFAFATNLESRKIRGEVSEAMLLTAVEDEDKVVPLVPEREVKEGTAVM
ncbi:MAG: hypothetical protein QXX19_05530 [Candidatus Caldarchaeum sp.]